ncbi:MAG: DNA primase, partial [Cellulophaga baltica]
KDAESDPVKRADTVRDIVHSISKIPDRIQKEIYIQECAQIMNISEAVLFNTLAQIDKKDVSDTQKKAKVEQKEQVFNVVKNEEVGQKVDVQFELERKIIEILLLYGNSPQEFEDLILKENEKGDLELEPEKIEAKVYEKIFLDLQDDEIELSNEKFKNIYGKLIQELNENEKFSINTFIAPLDQEMVSEISSILMEEEKYVLHDWARKEIYPKEKEVSIAQLTNETILTLRCFLIKRRINALQSETTKAENDHREILEEIMNYIHLNTLLNKKLNRVLS